MFENTKWISAPYHNKKKNRKRDETILHYPNAMIRRSVDKVNSLIGYENREYHKAPCFRKVIHIKELEKVEINITGLGYYELYINSKRVSNDLFSPPYSQYEKRVYYDHHDVTSYLHEGDNVIGVILGSGMYNVHVKNAWNYDVCHFRGTPCFIMSGFIEASENINLKSDTSWKVGTGPIISDDIYGGEYYDARLENDWLSIDFDDSEWKEAVYVKSPTKKLVLMNHEPIRKIREIKPINYWKIEDKKYIFDLGENITGFIRLKASAKRDTVVTLTHGEMITANSLDMTAHYEHTDSKDQHLLQKDMYIFKGSEEETWEPRFTYHGFQYVEVEGLETVSEETITGVLIHNDLERIGNFECSNELLNKIFNAGDQSNTNNLLSIPTDCPHREKNGWTGDLNLSMEYFFMTYDASRFFKKWAVDIEDTQKDNGQICPIAPTSGWGYDNFSGPVWDATFLMVPWHIYLYKKDIDVLKRFYPSLKRYYKWQESKEKNNLITYGLGDWCSANRPSNKPKAPIALTSTCYHLETARILSKMALILGYENESLYYHQRSEVLKKAIVDKFVDKSTGEVEGDCQTSFSAILFFDLLEGDLKDKVLENLLKKVRKFNWHVDTGIIGTKFLLEVLSENGLGEDAYKIATQTDEPSWGYWIKQGATTLWENWDGTQSRNHRMFNSINSWMYKYLAGIKIDEERPGFEKVIIKPNFINDLSWVRANINTIFGPIHMEWRRVSGIIELSIDAPKKCILDIQVDNSLHDVLCTVTHSRKQ